MNAIRLLKTSMPSPYAELAIKYFKQHNKLRSDFKMYLMALVTPNELYHVLNTIQWTRTNEGKTFWKMIADYAKTNDGDMSNFKWPPLIT